MYKLIALDLDDTLLDDTGKLSEENIKALEKARDEGVIVVLCSGRPSLGMYHILDQLGLNKEGEYYISFNGAIIRDCNRHNKIYEELLEYDLVDKIIDLGRQHDLSVQLYVDDDLYVEKFTERTKDYELLTGVKAKLVEDLKEYSQHGVIKVLMNDDHDKLSILFEEALSSLGDQLHIFFSRDNLLEFISKKTNKGIAVIELAKRLGINKEEVIAVGDSYNDIYMIEMAGLGVTVSNGRQEVKNLANYVTTASNNEHAVKEVIERFILNKDDLH